jgi:hypothetical protein
MALSAARRPARMTWTKRLRPRSRLQVAPTGPEKAGLGAGTRRQGPPLPPSDSPWQGGEGGGRNAAAPHTGRSLTVATANQGRGSERTRLKTLADKLPVAPAHNVTATGLRLGDGAKRLLSYSNGRGILTDLYNSACPRGSDDPGEAGSKRCCHDRVHRKGDSRTRARLIDRTRPRPTQAAGRDSPF